MAHPAARGRRAGRSAHRACAPRFVPIELTDDAEAKCLWPPGAAVTVLSAGGEKLPPDASARKTSPTESPPVFRAARLGHRHNDCRRSFASGRAWSPSSIAPVDYYLQRRLFPSERVAKSADSQDKVERLSGRVRHRHGRHKGTLHPGPRRADEWELKEPVRDRPDPDKLQSFLTTLPDIWAEQFVRQPKKDLAEYGLTSPETLTVTRPGGDKVTLLVGKKSPVKIDAR